MLTVLFSLFSAPAHGKSKCLGGSVWDRLTSNQRAASQSCLQCHDGSIASNVNNHVTGVQSLQMMTSAQHPVDINYAQAYMMKPSKLQHPLMIDSRVTLPGGKVHCLSCHDFASKAKSMLVMPNRGSSLCLSCHRM